MDTVMDIENSAEQYIEAITTTTKTVVKQPKLTVIDNLQLEIRQMQEELKQLSELELKEQQQINEERSEYDRIGDYADLIVNAIRPAIDTAKQSFDSQDIFQLMSTSQTGTTINGESNEEEDDRLTSIKQLNQNICKLLMALGEPVVHNDYC